MRRVMLPAGSYGGLDLMTIATLSRPRRALRAGLTALAVFLATVVFLPASRAVAAGPAPADLVVAAAADPSEVGPAGGSVNLVISVRNIGGADADDTAMKI